MLPAPALAASAGDLDASFGTGGVVEVRALDDTNSVDLALLPDGRLETGDRKRVIRYLPTGQPDPSFGANGVAFLPEDLVNASGVAVDAEGRTLVTGTFFGGGPVSTALYRLLPDGTADDDFGDAGLVTVDVATGANEGGESVVVQPDGKYVVAGRIGVPGDADEQQVVLRVRPDGTPDPAFAGDGSLVFGTTRVRTSRVAMAGTAVLVSGYQVPASSSAPASGVVTRILAGGILDPSFSGDGIATTPGLVGLQAADALVLPDGRIRLVSAVAQEGAFTSTRGVLDGLTANGGPDPAVGPAGQRVYDLTPGTGTVFTTAALSGASIVVAGSVNVQAQTSGLPRLDPAVVRLDANGQPDPTFSGDGLSSRSDPGVPLAGRVRVDQAGRVVTGGIVITDVAAGKTSTRVARYLAVDDPRPPAPPTPPVAPPVASTPPVITLPAARGCLKKPKVALTVTVPPGATVASVTAKVGRSKSRAVKPTTTLKLPKAAGAKVKVKVTATSSAGVKATATASYTVCGRAKG